MVATVPVLAPKRAYRFSGECPGLDAMLDRCIMEWDTGVGKYNKQTHRTSWGVPKIEVQDLYALYCAYRLARREDIVSARLFHAAMRVRGHKKRSYRNKWYWIGLVANIEANLLLHRDINA